VLEAAFMSMCHFCFRCRQPACPACWDEVHRVCAECVQEAHLSFRADVPPLQGTIFPAPITASSIGQAAIGVSDAAIAPLLTCVRPGRFQQENSPAVTSTSTINTQQTIPPVSIQQAQTPDQLEQLEFANSSSNSALHLHKTTTTPAKKSGVSSHETTTPPAKSSDVPFQSNKVSILKMAERVLNVILFSLLVVVILLIIVAELSSTANAQIMVLLRVDIRSEIAYILYIIQQLRW
jgi:hypothetical protein